MALLHLISLQFSVLAMDLICVKDKRNCNINSCCTLGESVQQCFTKYY